LTKIKNIEFLRVFLIISIVFLHTCSSSAWSLSRVFTDIPQFDLLHDCFAHANNCVEGFFIIAGFLLILTYKSKHDLKDFIKKKYIRLSPVILFVTIISAAASLFGVMHFKVFPNIMTVLLLNHFGICLAVGSNPVLWFTSALFSGLLLYFCIIKFQSERFAKTFCIIVPIISYGLLEIFQHGDFSDPYHNYLYIFNVGFMRAAGGIGLGCAVGYLYKGFCKSGIELKNSVVKTLITILEGALAVFIFWWIAFPHLRQNSLEFVLGFTILLTLFVMKQGYLSKILDKNIWVFLGKFQYSIYVVHYTVGKILVNGLWKNIPEFVYDNPDAVISVTAGLIFIVGIFTYYMVEFPCTKYLKEKFLNKPAEN